MFHQIGLHVFENNLINQHKLQNFISAFSENDVVLSRKSMTMLLQSTGAVSTYDHLKEIKNKEVI